MKRLLLSLWALGLILLQTSLAMAGNRYRSDLLQKMAEAMGVSARLDTLPDGLYQGLLNFKSHPVTVWVSDSTVIHIGYAFFSPQLREYMDSPALDFVERYVLDLDLPRQRERSVERHLDEDGVVFRNCDMKTLHRVAGDTTLAVKVDADLNDKRYTVHWLHEEGDEVMAVNFPIDYNLLAGTDMDENERRILSDICKSPVDPTPTIIPDTAKSDSIAPGVYMMQKGYFYLEQLNGNSYYEQTDSAGLQLLYSPDFIDESLANLFTTGQVENDYTLKIRLVKYGFVQDSASVKLNQWINYCISRACKPYFGVIDIEEGVADCELVMWNPQMGYVHVMRLSFDISTMEGRQGMITARLNSFVGINKVKYLFDEIKK